MSKRKFDRKAMREALIKRTQESEDRKEGGDNQKYFKDDIELTFAKFGTTKEDPHIIDIIPFAIGDKSPSHMKLKKGDPAYYLDIYVHQNIGPGKAWIVCPAKNYGDPCPICEHIEELVEQGQEWEDYSNIAPKRRCVYNVVVMTTAKEEKKGVQIWEVSYKYSEKLILAQAKNARSGGSTAFADPDRDVGQSISFNVESDTYRSITGHKLISRDYDIPDDVLEEAFERPLDQIVNILSYKEIDKIFSKVGESDDEENKNEDGDVRDYEPPDEDRSSRSRDRGRSEEREDRDRDRGRDRDRDDRDRDDRDRDDRGRDRDRDDRGRGERSGRSERRSKEDECPAGLEFGKDIDTVADCDTCKVFDACNRRADEIEDEKRKARESRTSDRGKINRRQSR